jgi:hypothetical protein
MLGGVNHAAAEPAQRRADGAGIPVSPRRKSFSLHSGFLRRSPRGHRRSVSDPLSAEGDRDREHRQSPEDAGRAAFADVRSG